DGFAVFDTITNPITYGIPVGNCVTDTKPNCIAVGYQFANAIADSFAIGHQFTNTIAYGKRDAIRYIVAHRVADGAANTKRHSFIDGNAFANVRSDADSNCFTVGNSDRHAVPDADDFLFGHRNPHRLSVHFPNSNAGAHRFAHCCRNSNGVSIALTDRPG
ncbi:MAG TPA: hypothetical protein PKH51_06770, partial [Candidatus Sumerlaeota bacterium]|nr:hypothetical protein [Candidatus Sumerlaeota bacterium]